MRFVVDVYSQLALWNTGKIPVFTLFAQLSEDLAAAGRAEPAPSALLWPRNYTARSSNRRAKGNGSLGPERFGSIRFASSATSTVQTSRSGSPGKRRHGEVSFNACPADHRSSRTRGRSDTACWRYHGRRIQKMHALPRDALSVGVCVRVVLGSNEDRECARSR